LVALLLGCGSPGDKPQENTKENEPIIPTGVKLHTETLKRLGNRGDNWCTTWLPSVVWNEGLGLYIMVNGGTYAGHGLTNSDEDYYVAWKLPNWHARWCTGLTIMT
jgi:hypothetical protein